jgi:HlyD family secretion protein
MTFKGVTMAARFILGAMPLLLILVGCGGFASSTPTPLPTIVLDSGGVMSATGSPQPEQSGATASGIIIPTQEVNMSSAIGGNVTAVKVVIGQQVKAGDILVELAGKEKLTAAIEAANVELLSAQLALKTLNNNTDQVHSAALLRLANAQKALDEAEKRRTWKDMRNGSRSSIELAEADYIMARDALDTAEEKYQGYEDRDKNDLNRASALSALAAARKAHDKALANLNYLLALPNAIEVNKAEAELQSAQAEVALAQKEVDKLKAGPDPDEVALANGRVRNAEAQIAASKADLAELELKAPFDGTVGKVNVQGGEWVLPGEVIVVVIDTSHLRVETNDLSERDISAIKPGQTVSVFVKALSQSITGKVSEVSPLADTLGGDVVYKTIIDLDESSEGLRAGMTVDVQFETRP